MRFLLRIPSLRSVAGDLVAAHSRCLKNSANDLQRSQPAFEPEASLCTIPHFRCPEENPLKHTINHEGQFYSLSPATQESMFPYPYLSNIFLKLAKAMNDYSIMVRKPALEVMHYLRTADYNLPAVRYILYGRRGVGKTLTLTHLVHFASEAEFLIVHLHWAPYWVRSFKEATLSLSRPPRMDLPSEGVQWLQHFKSQNRKLLEKLKLCTTNTYVWSKRETTEKGDLLTNMVDLGITRPKFSCDCVAALLKEIKILTLQKKVKTFVAVDGVNAFFHATLVKREDKSVVAPDDLTLIHAFLKILKIDWNNSAIVCTVDEIGATSEGREDYQPSYLLGKKGFEWLDPFVPVEVKNYSEKEIGSCLDYFIERQWIQHPKARQEAGKKELIHLSGFNPLYLVELCKSL